MLGTLITEWDEGRLKCEQLLRSRASAEAAAEQLARLAQHHGFDGWLVNIENKLSQRHVKLMLHFVGHLRKAVEALVPGGMVMWCVALRGPLLWATSMQSLLCTCTAPVARCQQACVYSRHVCTAGMCVQGRCHTAAALSPELVHT